jgi:hypothetical protein
VPSRARNATTPPGQQAPAASDESVVLTGTSWKVKAQLKRLAVALPEMLSRPEQPERQESASRRPQVRLTPELVQQLVADYEAGASMTALADCHGLHRTTVASHLRGAGVEFRRQGLNDGEVREASRLYADGWPLSRLGARYDCAADTVRLALLRAGVSMRRPWERG